MGLQTSEALRFRIWGLGFNVKGSEFEVQDLRFRVSCLGFNV